MGEFSALIFSMLRGFLWAFCAFQQSSGLSLGLFGSLLKTCFWSCISMPAPLCSSEPIKWFLDGTDGKISLRTDEKEWISGYTIFNPKYFS